MTNLKVPKHYKYFTNTCEGSFPNSLCQYRIWDLYMLGLKPRLFCRKKQSDTFSNSQCQNSADSLDENTPNASKHFSSI